MNLLKFGKIFVTDQIIIDRANNKISQDEFDKYFDIIINYTTKKMPLTGDDLLELGFQPGKTIGEIISKLEVFWAEKNFKCSKNECIKFVREFLP